MLKLINEEFYRVADSLASPLLLIGLLYQDLGLWLLDHPTNNHIQSRIASRVKHACGDSLAPDRQSRLIQGIVTAVICCFDDRNWASSPHRQDIQDKSRSAPWL
jgi:hypothetical protein